MYLHEYKITVIGYISGKYNIPNTEDKKVIWSYLHKYCLQLQVTSVSECI